MVDSKLRLAPGKTTFAKATGITEARWSGRLWARWSDALAEAGLSPNLLQGRVHEPEQIVRQIADLVQELGRLPTRAEIKLARQRVSGFPLHSVVTRYFPTNSDLIVALNALAQNAGYEWLQPLLPKAAPAISQTGKTPDGFVYLLHSGDHYKVGHSANLERRIKEVTVALPSMVTLVHAIRTDDPVGIESYWHSRFADRRANGEWFRLTPTDVQAFKRRTFQ